MGIYNAEFLIYCNLSCKTYLSIPIQYTNIIIPIIHNCYMYLCYGPNICFNILNILYNLF